jgi:hypothetical protein
MAIEYTNRFGVTYYLRCGRTARDRPRYYFSRQTNESAVDNIPAGYMVRESIDGVVSLAKERPELFRVEEIRAIESAVGRHPMHRNYRVAVSGDYIQVYQRVDLEAEEAINDIVRMGFASRSKGAALIASREQRARYTPVLRFGLADQSARRFCVQRMSYRGDGGWLPIGGLGPLPILAKLIIPTLGADAFFELF